MDAIRTKFQFEEDICSLQVTYLAEVFMDETLDLLVSAGSNNLFYVLGRKSGESNTVFLMEASC
jgi:hypothetical protein